MIACLLDEVVLEDRIEEEVKEDLMIRHPCFLFICFIPTASSTASGKVVQDLVLSLAKRHGYVDIDARQESHEADSVVWSAHLDHSLHVPAWNR